MAHAQPLAQALELVDHLLDRTDEHERRGLEQLAGHLEPLDELVQLLGRVVTDVAGLHQDRAFDVGIAIAGVAFAYKLAEFIFTLNSNSVQGFADVPVTIYFFVAAGWLILLGWSWKTGKFKDIESTKWDMLRQETEYERRGE